MRGGVVVNATNDGHPMDLPGQEWKMFADVDAGNRGSDGNEFAPDVLPRVGLEVPGIQMADPAPRKENDAGLRAAKARVAFPCALRLPTECEERRWSQAERAKGKEVPTG